MEGYMVDIDRDSPPGSWQREMERAPWAFGQQKIPTMDEIVWKMRRAGLSREADIVLGEIAKLRDGKP